MADKFVVEKRLSLMDETKHLSSGYWANSVVDSSKQKALTEKLVRNGISDVEHDWDSVNLTDAGLSNSRKFRRQRLNTFHGIDNGGFDRYGKREFERRSGSNKTGLKAIEKRAGAGAHNWGSIKDIVDELEVADENLRLMNGMRRHTMPNHSAQLSVRRSAQQQLTLDEWKAMQRQQPKANFDLRRPGEGCAVDPVWTQMRALDKKDHEVDQTVMNHRHQLKEQLMQTVLPIDVTFKTKRSSVDDESDMGLKAHDISSSIIPNVSSEIDFPSLS